METNEPKPVDAMREVLAKAESADPVAHGVTVPAVVADMSDADAAEFDGLDEALAKLRATPAGRQALSMLEKGAATTASALATYGIPALKKVGEIGFDVGLEVLKSFAMAELEKQLGKLGGVR